MARMGRKPLAAGHVDHLQGSELAKLRLTLILDAMLGKITVADACERLGIRESRFHAMRSHWLQEALELLEPRRMGRPPRQTPPAELSDRLRDVEAELAEVREQLAVAELRRELAETLPDVRELAGRPPKKSTEGRPRRRNRPRPGKRSRRSSPPR